MKVLRLAAGLAVTMLAGSALALAAPEPKVGDEAPAFSLKSLDGKEAKLADFKGKVVLINWFATWCPPCNREVPVLQKEIWEKYKDKGVQVIAIDMAERGDPQALVTEFQKKYGLTYP